MKTDAKVITPVDSWHRVHTYHKCSPYHPDGRRILYLKFKKIQSEGQVCLLDMDSREERVIGESTCYSFHTGANQRFCDNGRKIIYHAKPGTVALYELGSGKTKQFKGEIQAYNSNTKDRFIEADANFALTEQDRKGIYIRNNDGSGKRLLANVGQLLDLHPKNKSIRANRLLFRIGGDISPNQKKAVLYLVTRYGNLIKDFYICNTDGAPHLEYIGAIGNHLSWHASSRAIYSHATTWNSRLGILDKNIVRYGGQGGFLARYDLRKHRMEIASDFHITGGCHVSCSPDGRYAVLDSIGGEVSISILLYDDKTGKMRILHSEEWDIPNLELIKRLNMAKDPASKLYDINPHPVFSRDGRKVVFNSCTDGVLRLREITISW